MKTVVVGVFPEADDARRVLTQLVASTLDLDAVRVIHKRSDIQREMAAEAGLRPDRSVPAGMVAGALLGAVLGFGVGLNPDLPLASAGPLFLGALGLALGGAIGGIASGLSDSLPVPAEQLPELVEAVDAGAAVLLVRTDSLPTARAIRDLFQAGGSAVLEQPDEDEVDDGVEPAMAPPARAEAAAAMAPLGQADPAVPDSHAPFVPPWRRLFRGGTAKSGAAPDGAPSPGQRADDAAPGNADEPWRAGWSPDDSATPAEVTTTASRGTPDAAPPDADADEHPA